MALGNLFKLAKLTITAFSTDKRREPSIGTFAAQYNPESLQINYESVFSEQQAQSTGSAESGYLWSKSEILNVKLVFDGTQVGSFGVEERQSRRTVAQQLKQFVDVCQRMNGDIHEPNHLRITWNQDVLEKGFDCRLQSASIDYTSFDRDGSPLHAELSAVFVKSLEAARKAKEDNKKSPDVSHRRVVVAGDTLPALCQEVYGTNAHYLRVALANALGDFRNLTPGQELVFPPLARRGRA